MGYLLVLFYCMIRYINCFARFCTIFLLRRKNMELEATLPIEVLQDCWLYLGCIFHAFEGLQNQALIILRSVNHPIGLIQDYHTRCTPATSPSIVTTCSSSITCVSRPIKLNSQFDPLGKGQFTQHQPNQCTIVGETNHHKFKHCLKVSKEPLLKNSDDSFRMYATKVLQKKSIHLVAHLYWCINKDFDNTSRCVDTFNIDI